MLITRSGALDFIDSADAVCERKMGGVSLLCRGVVLAAVRKNSKVILRLPYSSFLYGISTGGKTYSR